MQRKTSKQLRYRYVDLIPNRHDSSKVYSFFRRNGLRIALHPHGDIGSAGWLAAYQACIAGDTPTAPGGAPKKTVERVSVGTIEHWITSFCAAGKASPGNMSAFKRIRALGLGDLKPEKATRAELGEIVDNLAKTKPGAASDLLKAFGCIYRQAGLANPLAGFARPAKKNALGHHSWEEHEIEQYRAFWPLGTVARLALEIFLYTALRCSDARRVGPGSKPATLTPDGKIKLTQQKLQRFGERAIVKIPVHARLQEAIDAMGSTGAVVDLAKARAFKDQATWLVDAKGEMYRNGTALSDAFGRWCDKAGLKHCRAHGLRKACAKRLIEAGVTPADAAAITGHLDLQELMYYAAAWNKEIGAARGMAALA
jgi:hypothetical protein